MDRWKCVIYLLLNLIDFWDSLSFLYISKGNRLWTDALDSYMLFLMQVSSTVCMGSFTLRKLFCSGLAG